MVTYEYSIINDFPEQRAHITTLKKAVGASAIVGDIQSIERVGDVVSLVFSDGLSNGDKILLDSIVAAHLGYGVEIVFHATSKLCNEEVAITSDQVWQTLGGVVTNIAFFIPDLTTALGRITLYGKTTADGAELRVVEGGGGGDVVISDSFALGDTSTEWVTKKFSTNVPPRGGDYAYRLEGRLNGATQASIKFASMTLLEKKML